MTASHNGHPQAVDKLLEGGADVDLKDNVSQMYSVYCWLKVLYCAQAIDSDWMDFTNLHRMAGQLSWLLAKMAISRLWRDYWMNMQTLTCNIIV